MLRFLTAGESHGKCLVGVIEGLPRGLPVDAGDINYQLHRRQLGYGRGGRMKIERDTVEILSGVRHGTTLGSPISFTILNRDWENWRIPMSIERPLEGADLRSVTLPRPGHADLAGALKYQTYDVRDVLERASARETATRVAAGAFCRLLLAHFGLQVGSHCIAVGGEFVASAYQNLACDRIFEIDPESPLHCADPEAQKRMIALIDKTENAGDTLGGTVEVVACPVPPGLGSHTQWDRKLDGQIAQAMMSIPAVKAVEIGSGVASAQRLGSAVHDEIFCDLQKRRFYRRTNNAGGIEGGISNGEDIRVNVHVKPIPTLRTPLRSVDIRSRQEARAAVERSDTCVVPAAGVIAEAMLSLVLAGAFIDKFGGDSIGEIDKNFESFVKMLDEF